MNSVITLIAQLTAPLYIVAALLLLFRGSYFDKIMDDFKKSPALTYFAGILTLVIGVLWMLSIFVWGNFTECVFTIMGIIAFVKGFFLVLFPEVMWKMSCKCPAFKIIGGLLALVLGVWFLSLGYGLF